MFQCRVQGDAVTVVDVAVAEFRGGSADGFQFVADGEQRGFYFSGDGHFRHAGGGEQGDMGDFDFAADGNEALANMHVFAAAANILAGFCWAAHAELVAVQRAVLLHLDPVGTCRYGGAGCDADGLAGFQCSAKGVAREAFAYDGVAFVFTTERVTVHGGVVAGGKVQCGQYRCCEYATAGLGQGNRFGALDGSNTVDQLLFGCFYGTEAIFCTGIGHRYSLISCLLGPEDSWREDGLPSVGWR